MTRNIGTDANIDKERLRQQMSHPPSPASGYELLYVISGSPHGGLFLEDSAGRQFGPFITGSPSAFTQVVDEPGTSFANWTAVGGTWLSSGAVIRQTDATANQRYAKYNTIVQAGPFIFESEIQLRNSGSTRIGGMVISFDGAGSSGGMGARIDEGDIVRAEVVGTGSGINFSATINVNTWYKLRIISNGTICSVYLDGVLLGVAGAMQTSVDARYIGLYTFQTEAWFRNIKAWTLSFPA